MSPRYPTNVEETPTSPKVFAAVGGSVSAAGISIVLVWILGIFGVEMPPEVALVVGGLIIAFFTYVAAWFVPDPLRAEVYGDVVAPNHLARPGEPVALDEEEWVDEEEPEPEGQEPDPLGLERGKGADGPDGPSLRDVY